MFYNDADDDYSRCVFASISQPVEHPRERLPPTVAAARHLYRLRWNFHRRLFSRSSSRQQICSGDVEVECAILVALEHGALPSMHVSAASSVNII